MTHHMQMKAFVRELGVGGNCTSAGLTSRLAGPRGGDLLPQAGQNPVLAPAASATLWDGRSSELMAQLEQGGHCVVSTAWACALSNLGPLAPLSGPGDTAKPTNISE
jgi:hypothetical protein